jgi:hypothetical protein
MSWKSVSRVVLIAALVCGGVVSAHHSISMIEISTPVWVKGTVVRYTTAEPHTMIELEEEPANGSARRWIIEGPFAGRLDRILKLHDMAPNQPFVRAGDVIEVCGFRAKPEYAPERSYPDLDIARDRFIHGQVLVMPDAKMHSWGPYGKMDNCVRPGDQIPAWLEFLDRDTLARDMWCNGQTYTQIASVAPEAFVAEVNRRMKIPCK